MTDNGNSWDNGNTWDNDGNHGNNDAPPMRGGDDSPIAADDVEGLAILEASAAAMGKLYLRDWLDGLTDEERAEFGEELLALIEKDAAPAKPQPAPKRIRDYEDIPDDLNDLPDNE